MSTHKKLIFLITALALITSVVFAQTDKLLPQAQDLANKLKFDEAEALCKKIIKDDPENINVFTLLCDIYIKTGKFDLARFTVEELKDIKAPKNLTDYYFGKIYHGEGQLKDAPKEYRDAFISAKPALAENPVNARINQAAEDLKNNNFAAADEKLAKVLAEDPYNIDAYYNVAVLRYLEAKYDDSLKILYKITDSKVFYPYADYLIGKNLVKLARPEEGELYFKLSVKRYSGLSDSYLELANLYAKKGGYNKAIEYYNKAVDKNIPEIFYNIAVCYELLGDPKSADIYYKKYSQIK